MKIDLQVEPKGEWQEIEVSEGTTIEDLYVSMMETLPYRILAANVDNRIEDLQYKITRPCRIRLLDMRTQSANLIYQYSLSLIYLKAARDVVGDYEVEINNSLNKGLYTEIHTPQPITRRQVRLIEKRMWEIVLDNSPFIKEEYTREEAIRLLREEGRPEKERLLEDTKIKKVLFYTLEGYRDFFFDIMVPSAGYIDKFELLKYRKGVIVRFPHSSDPSCIPPFEDEVKLYEAFKEQTKWDALLGVKYVADLNDKIETGAYKDLIQLSEALHEKKVAQIADTIKHQGKRIILIAGPSSSGKTTFARRLCIQLRVIGLNPLYMGTDDYFVEREDTPLDAHGEPDYESLNALDIDLFNQNMNDLLAGKEVDLPEFDFLSGHKIFGKRIMSIDAEQPIVIEGIHGLNEKLTEQIPKEEKYKIYISPLTQLNIDAHNRIPSTDERMLRRMVRDSLYRGHDAQSTIASWPKVRAGENVNIFPYNGEADVLFNSYHVYEISVLRKYAEPLLEQVPQDDETYAEAVRMLKFLRYFRPIKDDSIIVNNSIIREFIGGSVFVE